MNLVLINTLRNSLSEDILWNHMDSIIGGFTDGDRAAFMAHELGASKIYLSQYNIKG